MKFKEGDKVQFISEGLLAEGVVMRLVAEKKYKEEK